MAKIAVAEGLQYVRDALQNNGYEVINLEGENVPACDCCVITGLDQNMMGIADTATDVSVINAEGLTAEQVLEEVKQRIQKVH